MTRQNIIRYWNDWGSVLSTCLVLVCLLFIPMTAHAQVGAKELTILRDAIGSQNNYQLWQYSRSFINYGLVIVLIAGAFATVLRINVDTYSIKKLLPSLVIAFLLANFSFQICKLVIIFADVLANSANQLFEQASKGNTIEVIFATDFPLIVIGLIVAGGTIGAFFAPFSFGASVAAGIIIGLLVGIVIMSISTLIEAALALILLTRYYVVQFLVIVSPIAFLSFGLPMGQSIFQRWWKYFTDWVFMKPLAFFLLALGGFILVTKPGGDLVAFVMGIITMGAAIYLPFKAGGVITANLKKFGAKGLGLSYAGARGGLAGIGEQLNQAGGQGNSLVSRIGRRMTGIAGFPEYVKEARGVKSKENERIRKARAASFAGDTEQEDRLQDERVTEFGKTIDKNSSVGQLLDKMREAETVEEQAAVLDAAFESKQNEQFFDELRRDRELVSRLRIGGIDLTTASGTASAGSIIMGGNRNGQGTRFSVRKNRQHHSQAQNNGQKHTGAALNDNGTVRSQAEIEGAPIVAGVLPRPAPGAVVGAMNRGTNRDKASTARRGDWVGRSSRGAGIAAEAGFSQGIMNGIASGAYDGMMDDVGQNGALMAFDGSTAAALRAEEIANRGVLRDQFIYTMGTGGNEVRRRQNLIRQIMNDTTYAYA